MKQEQEVEQEVMELNYYAKSSLFVTLRGWLAAT